jgi:uncharacterized protein YgiM (DUF1202 family)
MILRLGMAAALMAMWSCSGDGDPGAAEPVSAAQEGAKVPDAPGADTGEAPAKAAAAPTDAHAAAPEAAKPSDEPKASAGPAMTVSAGKLHVRKGPATTHPVARTLNKGEVVTPVSCEKHWCKLADDEFVAEKYLVKAP